MNGLKIKKDERLFENLDMEYDLMVIDEFDKIDNKKGYLLRIRKHYNNIKIILISNGDINNENIPKN